MAEMSQCRLERSERRKYKAAGISHDLPSSKDLFSYFSQVSDLGELLGIKKTTM